MSFPDLVFGILDSNSAQATLKYIGQFISRGETERAAAMCKLGYLVDSAIAVLTFLLVLATARWAEQNIIHHSGVLHLMLLYAASFLPGAAMITTSRAALSALGQFTLLARADAAIAILRTGFVLVLVGRGAGPEGVIYGTAAGSVLQGAVYAGIAWRQTVVAWGTPWIRGSLSSLKGLWREIAHFLFYSNLTALISLVFERADLLVLGYFRGPVECGYYRLARSLTISINYLLGPLQSVTFVRFAHLWGAGQWEQLRQHAKRSALFIALPLGVSLLLLTPLLPWLIVVIAGVKFLPAALAAQFLLIRRAVPLALYWLRPYFLVHNAVKPWFYSRVVMGLLCLGGFIFAAPRWGHVGVAGAQVLGYLLGELLTLGYFRFCLLPRTMKGTVGADASADVQLVPET